MEILRLAHPCFGFTITVTNLILIKLQKSLFYPSKEYLLGNNQAKDQNNHRSMSTPNCQLLLN